MLAQCSYTRFNLTTANPPSCLGTCQILDVTWCNIAILEYQEVCMNPYLYSTKKIRCHLKRDYFKRYIGLPTSILQGICVSFRRQRCAPLNGQGIFQTCTCELLQATILLFDGWNLIGKFIHVYHISHYLEGLYTLFLMVVSDFWTINSIVNSTHGFTVVVAWKIWKNTSWICNLKVQKTWKPKATVNSAPLTEHTVDRRNPAPVDR